MFFSVFLCSQKIHLWFIDKEWLIKNFLKGMFSSQNSHNLQVPGFVSISSYQNFVCLEKCEFLREQQSHMQECDKERGLVRWQNLDKPSHPPSINKSPRSSRPQLRVAIVTSFLRLKHFRIRSSQRRHFRTNAQCNANCKYEPIIHRVRAFFYTDPIAGNGPVYTFPRRLVPFLPQTTGVFWERERNSLKNNVWVCGDDRIKRHELGKIWHRTDLCEFRIFQLDSATDLLQIANSICI